MVLTCKPSVFQPLILMYLYIFCYLIQIAAGELKGSNGLDTIVSGQPLYGNETLISKGRKFELGFFTPRPNYTYVGMWYKYIPVQTVVWVANREAPIRHFSNNSRLVLADDGSLIVFSEWNERIWARNNSVGSSSVPNKGVLLDNGNFVLSDGLNDIWQSFDHPTDTWLPGGKIGVDNNLINKRQLLTPWKDQNDPSAAEFLSFGMDLEGSPELFLFDHSQIQWRSGAWDNHSFTSFPSNYSNFSYNLISQAKYFNYVVNGNTTFRYVLDRRGLSHMGWSERTKKWEIFLFCPLYGGGGGYPLGNPFDEPFKKHIKFQVPVAVFITIPLVFCISIAYFFWRIWRKKQKKNGAGETNKNLLFLNLEISRKQNRDRNNITTGTTQGENTVLNLLLFSFSSISAATNNFSTANKLGEGGFGPVYKGTLFDGSSVAVKRLSKTSGQGVEELRNETVLISKLQHRNLVKLLGCCIEQDEKILIYEYMPNKSLDFFLFDPSKQVLLNWRIRVQIIEGVSQGLLYLHLHSRLRIVHRDLKASNILLDDKMNPKISDFGMARIFGGDELQANTNRIVGTFGYMSPEYAREGLFSIKSDVFAFGVLLLEILSGRKNTGFRHSDCLSLLGYAWELWKANRVLELVDSNLDIPSSFVPLRLIHVGLLCVQESPDDRPAMSDVLAMFCHEHITIVSPKRPAFTSGGSLGSGIDKADNVSGNNLTASVIEGR